LANPPTIATLPRQRFQKVDPDRHPITKLALTEPYARASRRGAITRLLEDERWLTLALLLPTVLLLAVFIAYPFMKGVELSVTDAKVGVPGSFVGLHNFAVLANDSIFP
jgi:multiple sugar transport system permease protein